MENATDPRFGVAIRVPRLNWVFHGFYGEFYQAASAADCHRSIARFSHQPDSDFRPLAGRARSRIPIRRLDSLSRLGARGRHLSNHARRIGWTTAISANRTSSGRSPGTAALDSRLGNHAAFPAPLAPRAGPPGLLESDRTGHRAFHRRLDLPYSRAGGMRAAPGIVAGGPRSEKHVEPGRQCDSSLAGVRFDECVLRLGIHERDAGRAISGELSAPAHYVRYFPGKELRRRRNTGSR